MSVIIMLVNKIFMVKYGHYEKAVN